MERAISTRFAIAGEAEYKTAIKGINNELKTLTSEMARSKSEFQTQANSLEALSQKGELLAKQQEAQARKVEEMRAALENSRSAQDQYSAALEEQNTRVTELRERLEALKNAEGDTTEEQARLTEELQRAEQAQEAAQRAYDQSGKSVDYWQRSLNYAERDLNNLNVEIAQNDRYLAEAKASADGCATSIDQYGKAVKEAGDASGEMGNTGVMAFGKVEDLLGSAGLLGITTTLLATVKDLAIEYNESQSSMAASTGATGEELQALNDGLTEVMATAKSARGEVAGVMGSLYTQLNLRGDELKQHTAEIEEFSRATKEDMGGSVNTVTNLLLSYGKTAADIPAILDRLTIAHQNSRSGALALGNATAEAAFYADKYGMSMEEMLSMLAAFDLAGVDSNLVMRAMRKSYDDLADGGMTFRQVLAGMRDGTITEANAIEMFGQKADKMVKLVRDGAVDIDKLTSALKNSEGAMSASAKASETFGQKIKGFWNSIWNGDAVGSQYTGFYEVVTEQGAEIVETQEAVSRSFADVGMELYSLIDGFDGTSDSIGRMLDFLRNGDGQVLASKEGYDTFVETLAELQGGYSKVEAEQEKVAATVHKTVAQITANFNDLSNVTAKDVKDMIAALASQEKYMQDYATNMQTAAQRGVNEGLLKSLNDGSTQSAEILAGLVNATDDEIANLNEQWEKTEEGKKTFEATLTEMQGEFDEKAAALEKRYQAAVESFNRRSEAAAAGVETLQGAIDAANQMAGPLTERMRAIGRQAYNAMMAELSGGGYISPGSTGSGANPKSPTFSGSVGTPSSGLYGARDILDGINGVTDAINNQSTISFDAFSGAVGNSIARDRKLTGLAGG